MRSGIALGNMHLPDTIAPGNYSFLVYTNRLVKSMPEAIFQQPVTIKTMATPDFRALLYLADSTTLKSGTKPVNITLSVAGNDYLPVPLAEVKYKFAGADTSVTAGFAKTDKAGQLTIQMPRSKNVISAQIKKGKKAQYLYLAIPDINQAARVKFCPEGGSLVANMPMRVGWEATTPANEPLKVVGFLYENNKVIDTVQTDLYGMGTFLLIPKPDQAYTVKLKNITQKDTLYRLPAVQASGVTLAITKALANDTLNLQIRSTLSSSVYLHVHNFGQEFVNTQVDVKAYVPRRVKVALDSLPRGVTCIAITDSAGRLLAERTFFAHFENKGKLVLQTDKGIYNTREKVQLSVRLATSDAVRTAGLVSIACVQANRFEIKKVNDIETYTLLKNKLNGLPVKETYLGNTADDKNFLEQVLLIKGWRGYKWTDISSAHIHPQGTDQQSVILSGRLSLGNKPVKKPMSFVVSRDSGSVIITTDTAGNFTLSPQQMITEQDAKVQFLISTERDYRMHYTDPYKLLTEQLSKSYQPVIYEKGISTLTTNSFAIGGFQKAIQLKEVKVTASNGPTWGTNWCGDYVCEYNILNCPNHVVARHTLPVIGRSYTYNGIPIIYKGCAEETENVKVIRGIFLSKRFSGSDYSVANPTEPEYVSTIFWNHLTEVDAEKPTTLSFYTSDITGKYKIIVQGVTDSGVVYGQSYITVNKK